MIKKTIQFEDLDGNDLTEDFYFHLNKTELLSLEVEDKRGLEAVMQAIVAAEDSKEAFDWIKRVVIDSVGERSLDGKRFIKNDDIRDNFSQSAAMDEIVFELLANPQDAAAFFNGLMPSSMQKDNVEAKAKIQELEKEQTTDVPVAPQETPKPLEKLTSKQLQEMSREELIEAMREKNQG